MWNTPRMLASRISSNDFSTETPPRWTIASQPSTRRSTARLSARSHSITSSPARAGAMATLSETRKVRQSGLSPSRSTFPRAPAAPVSNSFSIVIGRQLSYDFKFDYDEPVAKVSIARDAGNPEPTAPEAGPRRRLRNLASELVDGIGARI